MSVVESLLCGTPVVSSDVGNVRELITNKHNGYVANLDDVEGFCSGIEWVLSLTESEYLRCQANCRSRANDYHNQDSIIAKLKSIYETALPT